MREERREESARAPPRSHPPPLLSSSLLLPRRTAFAAWTGDPYWNLSNAVIGFSSPSPLAAFLLACALAHAPATAHTFIPYISGPSSFTTAGQAGAGRRVGWGRRG